MTSEVPDQDNDPWVYVVPGRTPVVFDSPHSGTDYPADFGHCCGLDALRAAEDRHVEKLYEFAPALGIAWIEALFPRSYLDANRGLGEIDVDMIEGAWDGPVDPDAGSSSKVQLGKALIWKNTDDGRRVYDRLLTPAEVRSRIDRCWRPYHEAVAAAIDAAHVRHGYSIHLNCHSMPAVSGPFSTEFPGMVHADFVLGDRDGTSADPRLTHVLAAFLRSLGHDVAVNHPYKGVELVRRYGNPARHRHSIQLEANRRLYMDEQTFELLPQWEQLQADLRALARFMLELDPRQL